MLFLGNRVYVVDRSSNNVLMYDESGHFLQSISKYRGRASNEFIRIIDATTDDSLIYVSCDAPYQVMTFDKELHLLACTKTDDYLSEIATDGSFLYGLRSSGENGRVKELVGYSLDHLDAAPQIVVPPCEGVSGRSVLGKHLTQRKDCVYAVLPFDTKIHVIQNGKLLDTYELDFGEEGLLQHPIPSGVEAREFDKSHENVIWGIVNVNVSDSLLLFNTNLGKTHVISKNEPTRGGCITIMNNEFPVFSSEIVPCVGGENEVHFLINDMTIMSLLRDYQNNVRKIPVLKEIKERNEQDGSPIIVTWDIK